MSGGSWNYVYHTFRDTGERLRKDHNVKRAALGRLVLAISKAMRAIEWNDSGDGADDEDQLIDACIAPIDVENEITKRIADLRACLDDLEKRALYPDNPDSSMVFDVDAYRARVMGEE